MCGLCTVWYRSGSPGIWERAAGAEAEAETVEGMMTMVMVSAAGEAETGKAEASGVAAEVVAIGESRVRGWRPWRGQRRQQAGRKRSWAGA